MAKPNWPEIQRKFVEGIVLADGTRSWPPQGEVAAICGVSRENLNRRARAEGWEQQRHTFITVASQARQEQAAQALGAAGAEIDVTAQRIARRLLRQVAQHVDAAEKESKPISAEKLAMLMRTVRGGLEVEQLSMGRPTVISQEVVSENAKVQRARPALLRLSFDEIQAMERSLEPYRQAQRAIEAEANQGDKPLH